MYCGLCPNDCRAQRRTGACGVGGKIKIAKFYPHMYEEAPISGTKGSGAVFFCGCSLKCAFCQNYSLSRNERGKTITVKELADIFARLEEAGVHNINLVNPTHYFDAIAEAISIYRPAVPIVWNTHGYEKIEILKEADKFVDIYLPDVKYFSPAVSERYTGKKDYFEYASRAVEFMANKPLSFDENGIMKSGTIVRHLVLPCNVPDSKKILDWFKGIKDKAYINVMSQYTPFGDIKGFPELQRRLTRREYDAVIDYAVSLGITNMYYQEMSSAGENYIPDWDF